MLRYFTKLKPSRMKWTGTTGGDVLRPYEVAESEEKDIQRTNFYTWFGNIG